MNYNFEEAINILENLLKERCYFDEDLPCYQKDIEKVLKILKSIDLSVSKAIRNVKKELMKRYGIEED